MKSVRRLRALFRKKELNQQLSDEMEFHLDKQIEQSIAAGMSAEEARYAALRKFGGVEQIKEECRDAWGLRFIDTLFQDIRFGLRMLAKNPGFTAVAVLTLALGIGMNTAVFSVMNSVLLHPLAYPNADRLVWIADYDRGWGDNMVSPAAYPLWRDAASSFETMVAYGNQDWALLTAGESSEERIASVTDNFWGVAGAQAALGRLFRAREPNTIVLTHALFARRFGSDPGVIGKVVTLNGYPFTITGVLPPSFPFLLPQQFSDERREIDAYIPLPDGLLDLWLVRAGQEDGITQRLGPVPWAVSVVGKLKPKVSQEQAREEMQAIYTRVQQERYPEWKRGLTLHFAPLKEKLVGNARSALIVALGAVGFVLLMASANVANLLLARASTRQKETAIRAAMGAGRARLTRQLLVENLLLALLGGAAGLAVAHGALALMVRLGSEVIPRVGEAGIDARALAFTLAISLATCLLFGLGPAVFVGRISLHDALKTESITPAVGASPLRLRGLLTAAELALAMVLLTGAGLMLKSFWRMNTYPPGFEPEQILAMKVTLYGEQYTPWLKKDAYIRELLRRIEGVPGVKAAGVHRVTLNTAVKVEGAPPPPPGQEPYAAIHAVSAGYLRAMGVPLVRGDWPREDAFASYVVNETFVREMLGHDDPIGRHLSGSLLNGAIVGVVADFKAWQLDAEPLPEVYIPYQLPPMGDSLRVVVRTSGDASGVAPIIRALASATDPAQPIYDFETLDHALSGSIAPRRFNLFLLVSFAGVALVLALVGVYSVMAYLVAQRTREIGIRVALGAKPSDALRLIMVQGLFLASIGVAVGLVGAFVLTRLLASMLYGVKSDDPATFVTVSALLMGVALLASFIPARRATKVDPMVAQRNE
jgi:putative ABC transport system permease protein